MKPIINMTVPTGYRIIKKVNRMKVQEAKEILMSKKQRYYVQALKEGTNADLIGTYLVCPYCNKEYVSNKKYVDYGYWHTPEYKRIPDDEIEKWASLQIEFFNGNTDNVLQVSDEPFMKTSFKCAECGNVSYPCESERHIELTQENKKIKIKSEITGLKEVMQFKWITKDNISVTFPMFEVFTFNLKTGKVEICLKNGNKEVIDKRDVTLCPEVLEGSIAHTLISQYKKVRRTLKKLFEEAWEKKLPCCSKDITVNNLFKMTMFVGYPKEFYNAIPYNLNTKKVDPSFGKIAAKLQNIENIVKLFEDSKLPKTKTIKRHFFKNPALFFYLEEAEILWNNINDVNLFRELVENDNIFEILADIHTRPGVAEFIKDFCKVKGVHYFISRVKCAWEDMLNAAINYSCASKYMKQIIQEAWEEDAIESIRTPRRAIYSIPMKKPDDRIVDCRVDGYDFFWLRNSNDYEIAGQNLRNCLTSWSARQSPVVCVKKQDEYVAAIEVSNGMIVQARSAYNLDIKSDDELYTAFEKWREMYKLEWNPSSDDDDYEFLPELD